MQQLDAATLNQLRLADAAKPFSPVCSGCKHVQGPRRCAAFGALPVPVTIWRGDDPHTTPWPGDRGHLFDPLPQGAEK